MLDFPNAPAANQTFTGPNGVIWMWDTVKWVDGTQIGGALAPVKDPVFTGNPTAPTPPAGDADTSLATTAFVAAAVAPALNDVGRNLVMNGLFNINQRALSSYTASGYTLDRWRLDFGLDTTTVAPTPLGDAQRAAIGDEAATNAMVVNVTGNAGAGAFTCVSQFIEDVRRLAGKTVTVSFWAYATSGSPRIGVAATQVFGAGGSANNSINGVATPALTAVPVRYTVTVAYPTVSGKTVGTGNDHYSRIALFFSSGSTNNTFAGGIGVQSAVFVIWGVQLEIGSIATPLDYGGTPQQQLAACERFYQVIPVSLTTYAASGFAFGYTTTLRTQMRATPTTVISGQSYTSASNLSASPNGLSVTTWATSSVLGMVAYTGNISASADL